MLNFKKIKKIIRLLTAACSTEEFNSLSDRATEAITSALTITHELIQSLLAQVRESISCLFTLTDSLVSSDDLLLSTYMNIIGNNEKFSM